MPRDYSPVDSPLSSMASSDAFDDDGPDYEEPPRPSKRLKVNAGGAASVTSSAPVHEPEPEAEGGGPDPIDGLSDVSSDTSGDIPNSPTARYDDDDFQDQVTVCAWEGCRAGDLGNMDKLVEHIHNDHIESRQKKYTCEWIGCNRKGLPHASGYALKAHMRSHTREKPFYCYLPECDRAFTRSDALAKHMRTVHETEALRPSDPVPKSMQGGALPATGKAGSKLKIIIKTPQSHALGHDDAVDDGGEHGDGETAGDDFFTPLTEEQGFTAEELKMPVDKLYRLCIAQVRWGEAYLEKNQREVKLWEELYRREAEEKNCLLAQVIESEVNWHERRQAILTGTADVQVAGVKGSISGNSQTAGAEADGDGDGEGDGEAEGDGDVDDMEIEGPERNGRGNHDDEEEDDEEPNDGLAQSDTPMNS